MVDQEILDTANAVSNTLKENLFGVIANNIHIIIQCALILILVYLVWKLICYVVYGEYADRNQTYTDAFISGKYDSMLGNNRHDLWR